MHPNKKKSMTLKEKIAAELKDAMKTGQTVKRDTLRMLDSAIKNVEIEKGKREAGLSDEEVLEVIAKSVKQRADSIKQFEEGGRGEMAEKEKEEMEILKVYLPEQLSEDEIRKVVIETIAQSDAQTGSDMGKIMGQAMGKLKGKADGNIVRKIVQEQLEK
jgi:uncharacterized protein YqeY